MAKSPAEIFNDKINLIYEYNNKSPLFAKKANTEIENNNYEKAIEILNKGIKENPDYPVPYFILGKALALAGNFRLALKNIRKGSDLIHSEKTYHYYLREIEAIRQQKSYLIEESFGDDESLDENEDIGSVDESLDRIAREISTARISEISEDYSYDKDYKVKAVNEDKIIVSDTLAKIYIAQGEIKEAIKVYEKLLVKNPEKEDYYLDKINKLRLDLES